MTDNPFFAPSPLPFQAPQFDRIKEEHFVPAFEAGMKGHLDEVAAIVGNPEPATFANTIVPLESCGALLIRVSRVFFSLASANTSEGIQRIQMELAPRLAAHDDAVMLDPKLYERIEAVYAARASLGAEEQTLVEHLRRSFVQAGARLSETDKAEMRALNEEESTLTTEFETKLLAATKVGAVVTDDVSDLDGLSEADVAAAAEAAKERGLAGKWVVTLQNTTQQPVQVSLKKRSMRERLFKASAARAEHGDANDTQKLITRVAAIRARKAKLLGYPTYAAYSLDDQMAKTPERALALLTDMVPAALAKAKAEAGKMQALADRDAAARGEPTFPLAPWDWQFYSEQVRKADFALDDAQIKPYFDLDRVLKDGVFFAAKHLYGFSFTERHDLPVYHPDVRVFDVTDESGKQVALFYGDYFQRDNKRGGAWMSSFVVQSKLLEQRPVIFNVCNFTKPQPGQPALLTFDDVITMFHEFGHAVHGLSSDVTYPMLAGTAVPRDFVEFPSQFNENWATEPTVLANYAKHHQTGESMPTDMLEKLKAARRFNQGYATTEYLGAALLDMAWHTQPDGAPPIEVGAFEASALQKYGVDFPLVPPRYRTNYFAHVWGGGYGAGYYAYLWAEVLDHDAYQWFKENGGLTRANGKRFQDLVLSRGYTRPLAEMYREFRGKDPSVEPLVAHRGLGAGA